MSLDASVLAALFMCVTVPVRGTSSVVVGDVRYHGQLVAPKLVVYLASFLKGLIARVNFAVKLDDIIMEMPK